MEKVIGRPAPDEFAPHAEAYVELVEGDDAIQVIADQIGKTVALVEGMTEDYASNFTYAPGKWTVKQIIGHLSDTERVFAHRAFHLARRDATPLPSFEQNDYVAHAGSDKRPLASLIDELGAVRQSSLAFFRSLSQNDWQLRGRVSEWNLTVRGILFTLAGHELHHYQILRERYAKGGQNTAKV